MTEAERDLLITLGFMMQAVCYSAGRRPDAERLIGLIHDVQAESSGCNLGTLAPIVPVAGAGKPLQADCANMRCHVAQACRQQDRACARLSEMQFRLLADRDLAGAGEGAGRAEASQVVYRDAGDFQTSLEALRTAGWTIVAPIDPNAAIPEPKAGQVWVCGIPTIGAREVECIGTGGFVYYRADPDLNLDLCSAEDWNTWALRTGARPQETAP